MRGILGQGLISNNRISLEFWLNIYLPRFVHYQSLDQCQEAIRLMSGHPLGTSYLRVHLGKKYLNMKQGGDNSRNGEDNFRNGKDTFRNARPGGDNFRNARPGGDNFRSRGSEMSPNQTNGRSPKGSVSSDSRRASPGIFSTRADVLNGGDQVNILQPGAQFVSFLIWNSRRNFRRL